MIFFLDFDRTLFDTQAFYSYLIEHNLVPEPHRSTLAATINLGSGKTDYTTPAWKDFDRALEQGDFPFVTDNTMQFLYPDVPGFLVRHGSESIVTTSGIPSIQRAKIERAGVAHAVVDTLYAGLTHKGDVIATRYPAGERVVFVDDSPSQLAAVLERCQSIEAYEMRRDGKKGSGKYPVVRSLGELEAAVLK
jgi:hypothetical protein